MASQGGDPPASSNNVPSVRQVDFRRLATASTPASVPVAAPTPGSGGIGLNHRRGPGNGQSRGYSGPGSFGGIGRRNDQLRVISRLGVVSNTTPATGLEVMTTPRLAGGSGDMNVVHSTTRSTFVITSNPQDVDTMERQVRGQLGTAGVITTRYVIPDTVRALARQARLERDTVESDQDEPSAQGSPDTPATEVNDDTI